MFASMSMDVWVQILLGLNMPSAAQGHPRMGGTDVYMGRVSV